MSKVIVKGGKDGNFLFHKEGSEYSSIRVEETEVRLNKNGFEVAPLSAFIKTKNPSRFSAGQLINGKIIIVETLTPQFEGQEPKTAGADGDVIKHMGQPVYRGTILSGDLNAQDVLLKSDAVAAVTERSAE